MFYAGAASEGRLNLGGFSTSVYRLLFFYIIDEA